MRPLNTTTHEEIEEGLAALAADVGADIVIQCQLEFQGLTLIVHWDRKDIGPSSDLPREAHLFFSYGPDGKSDFKWAFVFDPARYLWALDEGLTEEQATEESRRMVESVREIHNYLLAKEYRFVKRKPRVDT